jgi:hypothetical protein
MESPQADFSIEGTSGFCTIFLLGPLTPRAFDWVDEHISEDAHRLGNAVAVEQRYTAEIVHAIVRDGLVIV